MDAQSLKRQGFSDDFIFQQTGVDLRKPEIRGRGGTLTSLISEGGALGGAALGQALIPIPILGAGIGAALGGFGGRLAENQVRDDRLGLGDALKEGAISGVFGAGPIRLGKAAFATRGALKAGAPTIQNALLQGLTKAGAKQTARLGTQVGLGSVVDDAARGGVKIGSFADDASRAAVSTFDDQAKAARKGLANLQKINQLNAKVNAGGTLTKSQQQFLKQVSKKSIPVQQVDDAAKVAVNTLDDAAVTGSKGLRGRVNREGARRFFGIQKSQAKSLQEAGIDPVDLAKKYGKQVRNIDDALSANGSIAKEIRRAEKVIQGSVKGADDVIDINPFVRQLQQTRASLARSPANANKISQLDDLITATSSQYKNGIPRKDALKLLRSGNESFGKAALDVTDKGAVRTNFNKQLTNFVRGELKTTPAVKKALNKQRDLITVRELLKNKQATDAAKGLNLGRLDFTRPGTFLEPLLSGDRVSNAAARLGTTPGTIGGRLTEGASRAASLSIPNALGAASQPQDSLAPPPAAPGAQIDPPTGQPSIQGALGAQAGLGAGFGQTAQTPVNDDLNRQISLLTAQAQLSVLEQGGSLEEAQQLASIVPLLLQAEGVQLPQQQGFGGGAIDIGKVSAKDFSNALAGSQALGQLEQLIAQDPGAVNRTAVPGGSLPGIGGIIRNQAGVAEYDALGYNIADALLRLRTGAQANESEIRGLQTQLMPRPGDSPQVVQLKLQQLRQNFDTILMAAQQGGTEEGALL